jgi:hypothetical protein
VRHDAYIADIRHVLDNGFALREKSTRHDGKRRVLAPAGSHDARQAPSASHNQFHVI